MSQEARELGEINAIAKLQGFLPYIEDAIWHLQLAVVNRVQSHQTAGTLTPDLALAFWCEYLAAKKLLGRLSAREAGGISAAKRLSPLLTGTPLGG